MEEEEDVSPNNSSSSSSSNSDGESSDGEEGGDAVTPRPSLYNISEVADEEKFLMLEIQNKIIYKLLLFESN